MIRTMEEQIRFWDRKEKREDVEKVYGDSLVRWLYETPMGKGLADRVLSRSWFSKLYGVYQNTPLSSLKIEKFIQDFEIPIEEYEVPFGGFRNFNEFFIRPFRSGAREFVADSRVMPAFAEARYLAWDRIDPEQLFPVKGKFLSPRKVLDDSKHTRCFEGGPMLLARLCPVDYHRFHFPDDGHLLAQRTLEGGLHSVNPVALRARPEIFAENERQVSILETRNFGKLAYVEVGAMCVGKIVQTHGALRDFKRGDEKGYFLFGGSTVIVLGEPGRWTPDSDLIANTQRKMETRIRLGESVAHRI